MAVDIVLSGSTRTYTALFKRQVFTVVVAGGQRALVSGRVLEGVAKADIPLRGPDRRTFEADTFTMFADSGDIRVESTSFGDLMGTGAQMVATPPTLGAVWLAADLYYSEWIGKLNPSGAVVWAPRGGVQTIYQRGGSIAAPLASFTGAASGSLALPGGNVKIPAGLLVPGVSQVRVRAGVHKAGTTAVGNYNIRLGTNGSTADNMIATIATASAASLDAVPDCCARIATATTYNAQSSTPPQGGTATSVDRTTNFNTASDNFISLDIVGNAADTHQLVDCAVQIIG